MNTKTIIKIFIILSLLSSILACSVNQVLLKSQLIPASGTQDTYILIDDVAIKAPKAALTKLYANTQWQKVGQIEKGIVLKTDDQVVIVNSFNVYEGYIVVNDEKVIGYYLPIEQTFIECDPVAINLVKEEAENEN